MAKALALPGRFIWARARREHSKSHGSLWKVDEHVLLIDEAYVDDYVPAPTKGLFIRTTKK